MLSYRHILSALIGRHLMALVVLLSGLILVDGGVSKMDYSLSDIDSELIVEKEDQFLLISGNVFNEGERLEEVGYQLNVERTGASGVSSSSQSGVIEVESGGKSEISSTSINATKGDTCRLTLIIRNELEDVVSTSRLMITIK